MPVPITRDTTYITSYHSSQGRFAFSGGYFFGGVDRAPLHAPPDALPAATASTATERARFPDSTFNATNYWVDAVFEPRRAARTRGAPLVSDVSPAAGADRRGGRHQGHRHLRRAARPAHRERRLLHARRRRRATRWSRR